VSGENAVLMKKSACMSVKTEKSAEAEHFAKNRTTPIGRNTVSRVSQASLLKTIKKTDNISLPKFACAGSENTFFEQNRYCPCILSSENEYLIGNFVSRYPRGHD